MNDELVRIKMEVVIALRPNVSSISVTCFNILKLCILPTECICVFRTVVTIKSDYFHKQH
jgi:hypothetical protein